MSEFDEYFEQQQEAVKLLANELEEKDILAKAVVQRLQQQIEECRNTAQEFKSPVEAVEKINERSALRSGGTDLRELANKLRERKGYEG